MANVYSERGSRKVPMRICVLLPHPLKANLDFFDRLGREPEIELTVLFCSLDPGTRNPIPLLTKGHAFRSKVLRGWILSTPDESGVPLYLNPSVAGWISRSRTDLVVVGGYGFPTAVLAIILSRLRRIPWILMSRSHWGSGGWSTGARRILKRLFLRPLISSASGFMVLGSRHRQYLLDLGAPAEKIFQFGHASDVDSWREAAVTARQRRAAIRSALDLPPGSVVSTVARLLPEKGIHDLLRAFSEFHRRHPDWRLVIVGEGPYRSHLERLVQIEEIRNVSFTGALPPEGIQDVLAISDVFCLPSYKEAWGMVLAEALASGVPAIVSRRVGAAPDLVGRPGAGLVFREGPEGILKALSTVADDSSALARMREATWRAVAPFSYKLGTRGFIAACRFALGRG